MYERGDSNPHVLRTLDPKSSASTNSATLAGAPNILNEPLEFQLNTYPSLIRSLWARMMLMAMLVAGIAACTPPREVVSVSERPERIPSTEGEFDVAATKAPERYPDAELGRFDDGRMWTFEAPPLDWWKEAYNFSPEEQWLDRARRGAIQFGQICSASLVSHRGLVMTNHHCARDFVSKVSGKDEALLDNGFYALDASGERRIPGLKVRQLVEIDDVSEEIIRAARDVKGWGPKADARQKRSEAIERRLKDRFVRNDSTFEFKVVELVPGVRYSAYKYRVYHDVRLVWVPELAIGRFGGDADNFEWPRHTLDAAFFRIWEGGEPLRTADHFLFDPSGADPDEPVFVVGNPGSTRRLVTVSQLEYLRDTSLPEELGVMKDRISRLERYLASIDAHSDSLDVRNDLMAARNQLKSLTGQHQALLAGEVISRTQAWEDSVRSVLDENDQLAGRFGRPFRDIALIQQSKALSAPRAQSFTHFMNPSLSSRILMRAMYGYVYALSARRGAPPDVLKEIFDEAMLIRDWPRNLEADIIAARLYDFERALGADNPTVRRMLAGVSAEEMADSIATHTSLADSAGFRAALEANYLASKDVTVDLINTIGALYFTLDGQVQALSEREDALLGRLAELRFEIQGDHTPPDAGFTIRITDGRVSGYESSQMSHPAFTTFSSLYALSDSLQGKGDWDLTRKWSEAKTNVDGAVPLNLVATTDITGGNSGSALLDRNLKVVGLVFDGNLESLAGEYVFTDEQARTIAVDVRALIEVLEVIEDADRLVLELLEGNYFEDESSAEAAR